MMRTLRIHRVGLISAIAVSVAMTGCRHRPAPFTIPIGAQTPLALEDPNASQSLPEIADLPEPELAPLPDVPTAPMPPRRRTTVTPREEVPPPVTPNEPAPAELAIGSLSTGGEIAPQLQQQAKDMISSILKRIAALPARTADAQKKQIRQVRNFLDQARQAVESGDAQGAKNLATKARLLMDDLEKR
jgi:hypothetical protein